MLESHPYSDIRHNYNDTVVSSTRRAHFIAKAFIFVSGRVYLRLLNMRTEGTGHLKTSKDPTGNRTQNFTYCGAVSQPTAGRVGECSVHKKYSL